MPNRPTLRSPLPDYQDVVHKNIRTYHAIPDVKPTLESLYTSTSALKETVEILTRQRGAIDDSAVTVDELIHLKTLLEARIDELERTIAELHPP